MRRSGGTGWSQGLAVLAGVLGMAFGAAPASAGGVGLSRVVQARRRHSDVLCAVLRDDGPRCWGTGPLGTGGAFGQTSTLAVQVQDAAGRPDDGVAQVAIGWARLRPCAKDTTAVCWGENLVGNLGNGMTTANARPVVVQQQGGATLTGITSWPWATCTRCPALVGSRPGARGSEPGDAGRRHPHEPASGRCRSRTRRAPAPPRTSYNWRLPHPALLGDGRVSASAERPGPDRRRHHHGPCGQGRVRTRPVPPPLQA